MTELPDERTDEALLHAIARQDLDALAELHRRYAGPSLALAHRYGLPEPLQAVEEGFMKLYRLAEGFARSSLPAPLWTLGMMHWHYCSTAPQKTSQPSGGLHDQ